MQTLKKVFSEYPLKHHAYGIESSQECGEYLVSLLNKKSYEYIFQKKYERLTIDDVRNLKQLQSEKTVGASIFIIDVSVIGNESQNALLKMFEEPTPHTFFILIIPNIHILLPTLLSRLEIVQSRGMEEELLRENIYLSVSDFLEMSLFQRFEYIKEITDTKNKKVISKREILIFLNEIEKYFIHKENKGYILPLIYKSKQFLAASGASLKMILETLAIQLAFLPKN